MLKWLRSNYPDLHLTAEIDRNWIWLCCGEKLKGDEHAATRQALSEYGFRFAGKGHPMASGNIGMWGHSCLMPTKFERRARPTKPPKTGKRPMVHEEESRVDPFDVKPEQPDNALADAAAFFNT